MKFEVKIPAVGESVNSAVIGEWQKNDGDFVEKDEVLALLETDKASVELPAEAAGLLQITKQKGEELPIGSVIAFIDTSAQKPKTPTSKEQEKKPKEAAKEAAVESISKKNPSQQSPPPNQKPSPKTPLSISPPSPAPSSFEPSDYSPAVRHLLMEKNLDPSGIQGTGKGGRLRKIDLLSQSSPAQNETAPMTPSEGDKQETREKMSTIRKRIAERLVASQQETATLTTFNEADMSQVTLLRKKYKDLFQKKFGIKLGFMGFFIKAVVHALKSYPRLKAFIEGDEIVYHKHCHISMAVSTKKGLIVPVIRYADKMSIVQIERAVLDYAAKVREGKITPDDLTGGHFTISNGGVFGSLLSTPILNPPQSGILGMHKIEQRPVVINGEIVIRPMMYLALSYDHRIVDGKESVGFLVKIKENIEDPARLLLNI